MRRILIHFAVYCLVVSTASLRLVSLAQQREANSSSQQQQTANAEQVVIGSGDLLEISVYGAPDFNRQVRVSDGGEISLPLIGVMKVSGLSVTAAEQLVQRRLIDGGFFNDPQVSIFEREYATQGISVLGEVQKPGIYPLPGARTLFDAISAAGGTTEKAGNQATITHRSHPQQPEVVPLAYNGGSSVSSNVKVTPGDTVLVSRAGIVYVVGDVRKPAGI